ncbi:Spore coat polysaccharide biosynthesis protein [Micromonospora lupini str. Lupac 08]|uniref:Spore coat polysaccharide biosynthesis protein n=1 Tax=Micromonospora lupini str. Lupac 08 TaxID=1150864 RepID=I0L0B0_9ACTN|nr:Spore coat polysaccharide biosynthesis protein [Micromonospora lupini str. Lupac 08]
MALRGGPAHRRVRPPVVVHPRRRGPDSGARRARRPRPGPGDSRRGGAGRGGDRGHPARPGRRAPRGPRHRTAGRRAHRPAGRRAQLPATARGVAAATGGDQPTGRPDPVDRRAAHLPGAGAAPRRGEDRPAQRVHQLPRRPARHHPGPAGQAGCACRQAASPVGARAEAGGAAVTGDDNASATASRPDPTADTGAAVGPRIVGIVQARMGSSRLPGKVLRPLAGRSVLGRVVRAARDSGVLADLVVATSTDTVDDAVVDECRRLGVPCHRGPVDDVLGRFVGALAAHPATRSCGSPPTARCSTRRSSRLSPRCTGPCPAWTTRARRSPAPCPAGWTSRSSVRRPCGPSTGSPPGTTGCTSRPTRTPIRTCSGCSG